jgi:hypothetical protein
MKSILLLLFAIFLALPAHAAPLLEVAATFSEQHADGSKDVWDAAPVTLASGMKGILQAGARELALTPTLKDGVVVVAMVLSRREGSKLVAESSPRVVVRPGQAAELQVGDFTFTIKVSLAK